MYAPANKVATIDSAKYSNVARSVPSVGANGSDVGGVEVGKLVFIWHSLGWRKPTKVSALSALRDISMHRAQTVNQRSGNSRCVAIHTALTSSHKNVTQRNVI